MNKSELLFKEGVLKLKENAPQIVISLIIAVLIWLFGVWVFIPLADQLGNPTIGLYALKPIISAIIGLALLIVLLRIAKDFGELMDGVADIIASKLIGERATEEKLKRYRYGLRMLAYVIIATVAYLFFLPILLGINVVIAGVVLIILVIWAVLTLINIGYMFVDEIEEASRLAIAKLEEMAKEEKKEEE
ncbi:conserved hypothetical protein [Methanocaldococcus infernus ME]|uniref:Uncharacterized protein n=1 Tax=Methanocaldococcus infernus (strain DSM 11812 / JCM 15783 / ME) TaxID=573063 RepID=D5VRC3_METIM|nr:hypothetical protein [Methanocaldococcus infernus]ADG13126.1 conserved hypothetical protein [Methanocaldococcus infernus ME]